MLKICNLTKKFQNKTVIDDVSFSVQRGQIACLLGSSGVGKSTLLRVLNNLEKFDSGTLLLDEKPLDITNVNKNHTVGMVFQQFNLFPHLTAKENITLALMHAQNVPYDKANNQAIALLTEYGLADKANIYPLQLSGGQKQRLALARMLALEPKIICLDEPTSALDPLLTTHVANVITELAHKGLIVLVATHDTTLLEKLSCTIHLMKHGKIIESAESVEYIHNKHKYPSINSFITGKIDT